MINISLNFSISTRQVDNDNSYCRFYFSISKASSNRKRRSVCGRFTGLSRLLLKHRVGRGPVHVLHAYWPVLCCSSPPAEPPGMVDRDRPLRGCPSGSRQRRLRGRYQSKASCAGCGCRAEHPPLPEPPTARAEGLRCRTALGGTPQLRQRPPPPAGRAISPRDADPAASARHRRGAQEVPAPCWGGGRHRGVDH